MEDGKRQKETKPNRDIRDKDIRRKEENNKRCAVIRIALHYLQALEFENLFEWTPELSFE
jgi:hypothetical protein